jgi:outer membrane biogenesis lipoprotein LolB
MLPMPCPSALAAHVLPCRFHRGVRLAALAAALLLACNAYAEDTDTETDQAPNWTRSA